MEVFDPRKLNVLQETAFQLDFGINAKTSFPRNVGHFGHIAYIAGGTGTGKSLYADYLKAAALAKFPVMNMKFDLGDQIVLAFDTEQSQDVWHKSQIRIYEAAHLPIDQPHPQFKSISLNGYTNPQDRQAAFYETLKIYQDQIGLLVIDRLDNLIGDANTRDAVFPLLDRLAWVAQRWNVMVLCVMHLNDASKFYNQRIYGALGRQLDNISAWGFYTKLWGRVFQLWSNKARYGPVPSIRATFDPEVGSVGHLVPEPFMPW